jgi:hypothetical protein
MVFTCENAESPIKVKHLACEEISEALAKRDAVPFREIGPAFDLSLRRDKMAAMDLFREACRKPKVRNVDKKRADKNKFTNELGEKHGKVFV